ncbi:hypothetical protein ONZ51_g4182 [Trametes cubensis]|uniref:Enoyl reductase (ER) domain-containing protein n=1 Tax=Trametes cubensis TaxID=1111947 RepID=A0AAD7TWD2_9APHY|nr:hypothetical protein ONZ51_g4182 [Trametes cubensis]
MSILLPPQASSASSPEVMTAYRFVPGKTEPQKEVVPVPVPGPDEVLVKILAAGVCHSDCHLLEASPSNPHFPWTYTLGHEGAGIVVAHGEQVANDPKNVPPPRRRDIRRRAPHERMRVAEVRQLQSRPREQFVKARASTIVPVPGNNPGDARLTPGIVAAATDAVMTPWRALKRVAELKPGQTVVILGCGGLGLNAIQIAKHALDAGTVIASDIKPESLAMAHDVGADYAIKPDSVKALLADKKILVDVVLDLVGIQPTVDSAVDMLRPGGTLLLVGLGAQAVTISSLAMTMKQLLIKGSFGGEYRDLEESLDAIAAGKVKPRVEERLMDECGKVVHGLTKGQIRARVALVPKL